MYTHEIISLQQTLIITTFCYIQREHILRKELGRVKVPTQVFTFSTKIWFPQHWMIVRQTRGDTEVMPTIIKDGAAPAGPVSKKEVCIKCYKIES